MKIAIFDPSGSHGHYAHTQAAIFNNDEIAWFIHEGVSRRLTEVGVLKPDSTYVYTFVPGKSKLLYYFKAIRTINHQKWDVVFFNTLESDWLPNFLFFLTIHKRANLVLTIHNIHSFFKVTETKSLRDFLKQKARRLALSKCRLNVYSNNLKECLLHYIPEARPFQLPYRVFSPEARLDKTNAPQQFRIVIPGTVDADRRDYSFVLEVAQRLSHLSFIRIILLGRPYGARAVSLMKAFGEMKDSVICYPDFVDEREFEQQMQNADMVWGPLTKYYSAKEAVEEYGISKETGITFAMIRYVLPGLFPSDVSVMDEIKTSVRFYNNADSLVALITELSMNKEKLLALKKEAYANSLKFSPEKVKERFVRELNAKLS